VQVTGLTLRATLDKCAEAIFDAKGFGRYEASMTLDIPAGQLDPNAVAAFCLYGESPTHVGKEFSVEISTFKGNHPERLIVAAYDEYPKGNPIPKPDIRSVGCSAKARAFKVVYDWRDMGMTIEVWVSGKLVSTQQFKPGNDIGQKFRLMLWRFQGAAGSTKSFSANCTFKFTP
jgi:hypothetical protein